MYKKLLRVLNDPKFKFTEPQINRIQNLQDDPDALLTFEEVASVDPYDYFVFHRHNLDRPTRSSSTSSLYDDENDGILDCVHTQKNGARVYMDRRLKFTFDQADNVYLDERLCGGRKHDPLRLRYLVAKTLLDAKAGNIQLRKERVCHSFLTFDQLKTIITKTYKLHVPANLHPIEGLYTIDHRGRYVLSKTDKLERGIASMLHAIHQRRNAATDNDEASQESEEYAMPTIGDKDQAQAVEYALQGGVSIIYGPPGTGKTHTIGNIIQCLKSRGLHRVRIMAPTGKAAKNVTVRLHNKVVATTMHRALYHDLSSYEVLIVDEVSLVAYDIFYQILSKVHDGSLTTLVLVGDDKQLPSVEQGQIMQDLLNTDFPKTELKTMYRSGGKAEATRQLINLGKMGACPKEVPGVFDIQYVATGLQYDPSAYFTETLKTIKYWWNVLKKEHGSRVSCISNIKNTCNVVGNMLQVEENHRVKAKLSVGDRVQYIAREGASWRPRKGVVAAVHDSDPTEPDWFFRYRYDIVDGRNYQEKGRHARFMLRPEDFEKGDYVQLTRNTKDGRYVNGDDGIFESVEILQTCDTCDQPLTDKYDRCWCIENGVREIENRSTHPDMYYAVKVLNYEDDTSRIVYADPDDVDYAYVRTVHKYQGLQNKAILFITGSSFGRRPMLYTGCSRWEEHLVLVTTGTYLNTMLQPSEVRQTRLKELVQHLLENDE